MYLLGAYSLNAFSRAKARVITLPCKRLKHPWDLYVRNINAVIIIIIIKKERIKR